MASFFDEPSLCCLADGEWGPALVAAGLPASEMSERTPSGLRVRRPLKRGVLQDIGSARQLLRYAVPKARRRHLFGTQRVIIGLPADATQAERRAMLTAAHDAGLNPLDLIPEPLAAAIGAGLAVREPRATMLVECGTGDNGSGGAVAWRNLPDARAPRRRRRDRPGHHRPSSLSSQTAGRAPKC